MKHMLMNLMKHAESHETHAHESHETRGIS